MRVYIETTIFNRYFENGREYSAETKRLFKRFKDGLDEPFTSFAVVEELEKAPEPKRSDMLNRMSHYNVQVLEITNEVDDLAEAYITTEIIPRNYKYDGIHIAAAAINDMDCTVSLNFHHINRLKTKTATKAVNLLRGYTNPDICTPMEVIEDET